MGSAIVDGLLADNPNREVTVVVREGVDVNAVQQRFPSARVSHSVDSSDVIVSVKPKDTLAAIGAAVSAGARRVLSVAAGITLDSLAQAAGNNALVVRAMPNLGAQFRQSATGYCMSSSASDEDVAWVESVLRPLGTVVRVEEPQIDAVTGIAGSGIAFVLLALEALIDAGKQEGLSHGDAYQLGVATLAGAAAVTQGDETPAEIRARVTTPNGTTAAGLAVLEELGIRDLFAKAVSAAAARSREMGKVS